MSRGIVVCPYSRDTERMAFGLVASLRRVNSTLPVCVLAQDYLPGLPWKALRVQVRLRRAASAGGSDLRWLNKLDALLQSPFDETIVLDCDIVLLADPEPWFARLATDDFTYHTVALYPERDADFLRTNCVLPGAFCRHFGLPEARLICGGGHYYIRRTERGTAAVRRVAEIMLEASESQEALYWKLCGHGNIIGDEPAATISMAECGIRLPEPVDDDDMTPPVHPFFAPWQHSEDFDFADGRAEFFCEWRKKRITPQAVHFAYTGKHHPAYLAWQEACISRASAGRLSVGATSPISPRA